MLASTGSTLVQLRKVKQESIQLISFICNVRRFLCALFSGWTDETKKIARVDECSTRLDIDGFGKR